MKSLYRFLTLILTTQLMACAGEGATSVQYNKIMQELKVSTSQDEYEQIAGAIDASPKLKQTLNMLADSGKFTGFTVTGRDSFKGGKGTIFGGFVDGSRIIFTHEFILALKQSHYFDVVYEDDIVPNNTVFALAHLEHHLQVQIEPGQYRDPMSYNNAKLQDEAVAFIEAWNSMLSAAQTHNGSKNLSVRQASQLLANTRYKFAFRGLKHWNKNGSIPADSSNIHHIVSTLSNSRISDLE